MLVKVSICDAVLIQPSRLRNVTTDDNIRACGHRRELRCINSCGQKTTDWAKDIGFNIIKVALPLKGNRELCLSLQLGTHVMLHAHINTTQLNCSEKLDDLSSRSYRSTVLLLAQAVRLLAADNTRSKAGD